MTPSRSLRVVFCWAEVSGYSAACFQALARRPGIDIHVVHPERLLDRPNPFEIAPLLAGVSHEMFDATRPDINRYLLNAVSARAPDVVVLCGWIFWPYTRLVNAEPLRHVRKLLGMDTPWRGTALQRVARLRLAHFIRGVDLVVTAGERSAEYARRIGVDEARLRTGFYGFDHESFAAAAVHRRLPWPRRFLFAGRYAPEKDLATLVEGYAGYRQRVSNPWPLTCRGRGSDAALLQGADGVDDAGFAQLSDLPGIFSAHGAFVLPSRFEPWGVVIAEAAAAGMPVICTSACGAAHDIVRPYYNGVVIPPGDAAALARAFHWVHDHESELPAIGIRAQALAQPFSAAAWAERWHNYMHEATDGARVNA